MAENDGAPVPHWAGDKWKDNETVKRFKDQDSLISSFIETKSKLGRSVELPVEMTFDNVRPVLERIGAPKDLAAYKLPNEPMAQEFAKVFMEAGVLPAQAERIMAAATKTNEALVAQQTAKIAGINEALVKEWGEAAAANAEKLTRFEAANTDTLEGKLYQAALKEDPRAAKEWALKQAAASGITVGKGPQMAAPTGKDDAAAKIKKYREESLAARQKGEKHWWDSPTPEQAKYRMQLYEAAG